jgi:hypothetical protein
MHDHDEFAKRIAGLLMDGEWKQAVAAIREWYAQHCPRLTKDDVELGVGWVGSALITWDQFQARTRIKDEKDRYRMTPEQAVEMFTATCAAHWSGDNGEAVIYRRKCQRQDNPEPAEWKIEHVLSNIARRNERKAGAA